MTQYRTFEGWIFLGRVVKPGEAAHAYRVAPDGNSRAAFALDQTIPINDVELKWELVHVDDRPPRPKPREPDGLSGDEDTGPVI
jgi:hypothetical protein